ncbi:hypothetical protein L210DRAFT_934598 [Boletus edulis BED1]|uniref:Uncharacterized protein n=1 Tax=Boletus edulis BED1 TaxID=1328754 RepID=A0AAD4BIZ0_BOLED|nr:hypothetical protein L210DRAFT_934598 [Boletus edulis BED1]
MWTGTESARTLISGSYSCRILDYLSWPSSSVLLTTHVVHLYSIAVRSHDGLAETLNTITARMISPDDNMDVDATQYRRTDDDNHLDRKACDLLRLALFCEHKRVHLRHEDTNKKAQVVLCKMFAMELVSPRLNHSATCFVYTESAATIGTPGPVMRHAHAITHPPLLHERTSACTHTGNDPVCACVLTIRSPIRSPLMDR